MFIELVAPSESAPFRSGMFKLISLLKELFTFKEVSGAINILLLAERYPLLDKI